MVRGLGWEGSGRRDLCCGQCALRKGGGWGSRGIHCDTRRLGGADTLMLGGNDGGGDMYEAAGDSLRMDDDDDAPV